MTDRRPVSCGDGGLLEALTAGKPTAQALDALWNASRNWLASGGGVPMERFAGLPTTSPSLRMATRDLWLRRAALLVPDSTICVKASVLCDELERFISRGPWRFWRIDNAPPLEASELRKALFYVAQYNDGQTISARHIYRRIVIN